MSNRPAFVRHFSKLPSSTGRYPDDDEEFSIGTPLSRPLGLTRLGIHHEYLPPGTRTSWPHAEEKEEEFLFVLEGTPDLWLDGELIPLEPGDCAALVPGTGIAHTVINNSDAPVRLLVVGEDLVDNRIAYAFRPEGWAGMPPHRQWVDVPVRPRSEETARPVRPRPPSSPK